MDVEAPVVTPDLPRTARFRPSSDLDVDSLDGRTRVHGPRSPVHGPCVLRVILGSGMRAWVCVCKGVADGGRWSGGRQRETRRSTCPGLRIFTNYRSRWTRTVEPDPCRPRWDVSPVVDGAPESDRLVFPPQAQPEGRSRRPFLSPGGPTGPRCVGGGRLCERVSKV